MRWLATSARSWAVGSSLSGWKRRTLASDRHWRSRSASRGAAGRNVTWGLERSGRAMADILAASAADRENCVLSRDCRAAEQHTDELSSYAPAVAAASRVVRAPTSRAPTAGS